MEFSEKLSENWVDLPEENKTQEDFAFSDKWLDLPKNQEEIAREKMRLSFFQDKGFSTEKAVRASELAKEFDVEPSLVLENPTFFEARSMADKAQNATQGLLLTQAYIGKNPANTALFKDDLENAGDFEKLVRLFQGKQTTEEKVNALLFSQNREPRFEQGNSSNTHYQGNKGSLEKIEDAGFLDKTGQAFKEGFADLGKSMTGFSQGVYDSLHTVTGFEFFDDLSKLTVGTRKNMHDWGYEGSYGRSDNAMGVWEDFIKSSPQMVSQIATAILSGGTAAAGMMGIQIFGGQYGQTREEGVDGGRAFIAALTNAGIQMPLEKLQMGSLLKLVNDSGLGRIGKNLGQAALTSVFTETVQNYPDAFTNIWARAEKEGRNNTDVVRHFFNTLGETTLEGLYEGALTLPYTLAGGAGRFAVDYSRYRHLRQDTSLFEALDNNAQNSKVRARLPRAYNDFVDYLVQNSDGANTIYVSPADFRAAFEKAHAPTNNKAVNNEEANNIPLSIQNTVSDDVLFSFLDKVGVKKTDFEQAETLGAHLEIPLASYQKEIAGTDLSLSLRGAISTSPDSMNLAEKEAFERDFQENVQGMIEETRTSLLQNEELDTALLPIREELEKVYGKDGAEQNVALLRARAVMGAKAWSATGESMTPAQWITEKWNVQVQSDTAFNTPDNAENVLYQDTDGNTVNVENVVDLSSSFEKNPSLAEVKAYISTIINNGVQYETLSPDWLIDVIGNAKKKDHIIKSSQYSTQNKAQRNRHNKYVMQFEKIINNSEHTNASRNTKLNQKPNVENYHYFNSHVKIQDKVYQIKLVAEQYFGENTQKKPQTVHLYDILEMKNTPSFEAKLSRAQYISADGVSPKENVNTSDPKVKQNDKPEKLHQDTQGSAVRGLIDFGEDATIIKIFRDSADMSTFVHEAGHLFIRDMEELVATGKAPQSVQEDLETLKAFTAEYADQTALQEFYEKTYQPARKDFQERDFASLSEGEKENIRYVAEQEKLADAFVTYLKEGNAPSAELKTAFSRFRDWLTSLYKTLRGYVSINDDVRGIFDRMLATDEEITRAEAGHRTADKNLSAVASEMLTEIEQKRLEKSQKEARNISQESRLSKTLKTYFKSLAFKKDIVNTAKKNVNSIPVYAVQETALASGGFNIDDVREEFGEETTKRLIKKRPGLFRKNGTVSLYEAALAYDFPSTEAFVDGMLMAESKASFLKRETEKLLAQKEMEIRQELEQDFGIVQSGEFDFYNNERLNTLLLERLALRRKNASASTSGANNVSVGLARAEARKILEQMPYYQALSIAKLSSMESRAAREAGALFEKGDIEGAQKAKNRQVISHAMVLEALEAREKHESFKRRLKGLARNNKMVFEYQEQIRFLSKLYKLGGNQSYFNLKKPEERQNIKDFIDNVTQDSIFEAPPFADFVLSETVPQSMTLDQLEEVKNLIVWLAREGQPGEAKLLTQEGTLLNAVEKGASLLDTCGSKYVPKETLKSTFEKSKNFVSVSLTKIGYKSLFCAPKREEKPRFFRPKGEWWQRAFLIYSFTE